ncbi:hypothetical protein U1701_14090 [Sphingomonas sp. PB2P19]|uniref:hypothetical protein n=1 Tax=Sphingomonas rhamnosi TaxID=3096156 RepID=UPI002FC8B73F
MVKRGGQRAVERGAIGNEEQHDVGLRGVGSALGHADDSIQPLGGVDDRQATISLGLQAFGDGLVGHGGSPSRG